MPFIVIGTSVDSEFVTELQLVFYDVEHWVAFEVESIQIGSGYPTFDTFVEFSMEMDEDAEYEALKEEYRKEAVARIALFCERWDYEANITAYGEIEQIPVNHKEQVRGIVLYHDEDDERPLNDMQRSILIGSVFDLEHREGAFF
jgi:hypothetical protein